MPFDIPFISSFEFLHESSELLPGTTALAVVISIAYLCGYRSWSGKRAKLDQKHQYEIERTADIAGQLEEMAKVLRHELTFHMSHFARFKRRLNEAYESGDIEAWKAMIADANHILDPTFQFAKSLSSAYSSIREHSHVLESFADEINHRQPSVEAARVLWKRVDTLIVEAESRDTGFSIAVVSLDQSRTDLVTHDNESEIFSLTDVALLIDSFKLETYFVVPCADDELAVVMPETSLDEASEVGLLIRELVLQRLSTTVSCGIAEYRSGETSTVLLMRARSALYCAKAIGSNRQITHTQEGLSNRVLADETTREEAPAPNEEIADEAEPDQTLPSPQQSQQQEEQQQLQVEDDSVASFTTTCDISSTADGMSFSIFDSDVHVIGNGDAPV